MAIVRRASKNRGTRYYAVVADGPKRIWSRPFDRPGSLKEPHTARWEEARLKNEIRERRALPSQQVTFGQFLMDSWLPTYNQAPQSTQRSYRWAVQRASSLHNIRLARLTSEDLQRYVQRQQAAGRSPNTIRLDIAVLSAALEMAVEWRRLSFNPAVYVRRPKAREAEPAVLSIEDVRDLLELTAPSRHGSLVVMALATTKRWAELTGLEWKHVDFERQQFRVVKAKREASERAVPAIDPAITALKLQRIRVDEMRRKAGQFWQENDLVFPAPGGTRQSYRQFNTEWHALVDGRFPGLHFHHLRHQAITMLMQAKVDPVVRQALAGHASKKQTEAYTHVVPDGVRAGAEALGALIWGT